jgi:hypothetical protein
VGRNVIGDTLANSFAPNGKFVPGAIFLPQLQERFAKARQMEEDIFELEQHKLQQAQVDRYLQLGSAAESDATQSSQSGEYGRQAAQAKAAGDYAGQAKAGELRMTGQAPKGTGGGLMNQMAAARAAVEGQQRAGGTAEQIMARQGSLDSARTELGATSGAGAASVFATPDQLGQFATNAASSRISGQENRKSSSHEAGLRKTENIRLADRALEDARVMQDLAVQEYRKKERIARRQAYRADEADSVTPEQFATAIKDIESADPAVFADNPVLRGAVLGAKAFGATDPSLSPKKRDALFTSIVNAATNGVTRTQTEVIDKQHARTVSEELRGVDERLATLAVIKSQTTDDFITKPGNFQLSVQDYASTWGVSTKEGRAALTAYGTWKSNVDRFGFDYVTEVAKSTFTQDLKDQLMEVVPNSTDRSPPMYRAKEAAVERYYQLKRARLRAFQLERGFEKPTQQEEREMVDASLKEAFGIDENGEIVGPQPDTSGATDQELDAVFGVGGQSAD